MKVILYPRGKLDGGYQLGTAATACRSCAMFYRIKMSSLHYKKKQEVPELCRVRKYDRILIESSRRHEDTA